MSRIALFFALTLLFVVPFASAEIPHLISLQGKLTNPDGNAITDAQTNLTFRIYNDASAGNVLWSESHYPAALDANGVFSVLLGSIKALNIPFNESYWLSVEVKAGAGPSEVLSPRQQMGSAGYALRSESPWNTTGNDIYTTNAGNVGIGTATPAEKLEVAGKIKIGNDGIAPSAGTIRWTGTTFEGYNGSVWISFAGSGGGSGGDGAPLGTIAMWAGTLATIPSGWQLCDGTGGTADLRARFVRGAPAGQNPGATGGQDSHTLTISEMPAHSHQVNYLVGGPTTLTGYSHGTSNYVQYGYDSTESTGGGLPFDNRPAYYEVAFICKVSTGGGAGIWTETASSIYNTNTGKNVGIGTANPGNAKLNVSGNISVSGLGSGIIFPDGSVQVKAGGGGLIRKIIPIPMSNTWTNEPNARDDNSDTYASTTGVASVKYDLGIRGGVMLRVKISVAAQPMGSTAFVVSVSTNDISYDDLITASFAGSTVGDAGDDRTILLLKPYRYLRITATQSGGHEARLRDIVVLGE